MNAVISVFGTDKRGIIAKVSGCLFEHNINIEDISQTIMQNNFSMIMMVDLSEAKESFDKIVDILDKLGEELGVKIGIQLNSIFDAMHKI